MRKYLVIAVVFFATLLQADYILKYQMDTDEQTFMYHSDSRSKMVSMSDGEKSEIYKIGKKSYIVSYEGGQKTVVDMDAMKKMSQSMGYDASEYKEEMQKPNFKIKKTSKRVTVDGIKGQVWIVSGEDDGEKFKEEIVVTKDKKVVKSIRAMYQLFASMSGTPMEDSFLEIQKGYVTIKAPDMRLKSFSEKKVASSEYQLPKDAKGQKMPDFSKLKSKAVNTCYEQVCCGNVSAESRVLAPALKSSFKGYTLVGSGVCDVLGLGSLLGVNSVEGALYKRGKDYIQVSLNMDDTQGGILRDTKKNLDAGHSLGLVQGIKNYSDKKRVNGIKVIQGELLPMKQETLEYILDSKTTLTISRIRKNNKGISLIKIVSSSGGVNLKKLQNSLKSRKEDKTKGNKSENAKPDDIDIDKAANLLKSFF